MKPLNLGAFVLVAVVGAHVGNSAPAMAQAKRTLEHQGEVFGVVAVTNNGISTIPSFTLGQPAAIFDVVIRGSAFAFEPQFKMGLDGRPWGATFWTRYRPLRSGRFKLRIGGYPALVFNSSSVPGVDGQRAIIESRRFLGVEMSPTYSLTKLLTVGTYYLYSHGIDRPSSKHTHMVAGRVTLTNVQVAEEISLQLAPQFYYLKADVQDGWYLNAAATVSHSRFPLSVASMFSQPFGSNVAGGMDFVWSLSAAYTIK